MDPKDFLLDHVQRDAGAVCSGRGMGGEIRIRFLIDGLPAGEPVFFAFLRAQ